MTLSFSLLISCLSISLFSLIASFHISLIIWLCHTRTNSLPLSLAESPKKKGSAAKAAGGQYSTPQQHAPSFPGTNPISSPYTQQSSFPNATSNNNGPNANKLLSQPFHNSSMPPGLNASALMSSLAAPNASLPIPPPSSSGHDSFAPLGTVPPMGHHIDNAHTQSSMPPMSKNVPPGALAMGGANRGSVGHSNASAPVRKSSTNAHISPPFANSSHPIAAQPPSHFKNG